ncbi:MAG: phosphopentomutase, partial [Oscillospiraceae bacterium]
IPNLTSMGLCNIDGLDMAKNVEIVGAYGKMQEVSLAKDTTAGHWEIAGAPLEKPFVTFVNGFPEDLILKLQDAFGIKTLCNNIASGTEVINNYGQVHMQTKMPIIYTSADSVLQIACHEDVYSNEELYHFCEIAREICQGEYEVGRVIARPFAGHMGDFYRTQFRKDFSVEPKSKTILEKILSPLC